MGSDDDSGVFDWYPVVQDFQLRMKQLEDAGYRRTSKVFEKRSGFTQHGTGTAADFAIAPSQVPAFTALAQRLQVQVVNEMDRDAARLRGSRDWTGPHMHVQLYKAGKTPVAMRRAFGFPSD